MAKAGIRIAKPFRPPTNTAQSLQVANEAWQEFLLTQRKCKDDESLETVPMAFPAFSLFVHALVADNHLRKFLLRSFDQYLLHAGASHPRTLQ